MKKPAAKNASASLPLPEIEINIGRQLAVFIENQPGTLADVCDELARQSINIFALTISDTTDHSVVRMVVSDTRRAIDLFEQRGVLVIENDVLVIDNDNKPGSLSKIARVLAAEKINIEYAYLASAPKARKGLLILRVSNTKRALETLSRKS